HFAPRAKRVIFMFMHGGPSHLDTFDPKPLLTRDHGKPLPFKRPLTFAEGDTGSLLKSPWQFRQYGESGIPVSELFPNVARHVDDLSEPIEHLKNKTLTTEQQRYELDMLQQMNRESADRWNHDPEFEARIQAFELAFRMQTEAPEAFDISKESEATKKLYGLDRPETRDFAWQCLMARRLAQRNVRFIQISHEYGPGNEVGWDAHSELIRLHTRTALQVDQPIHGLLTDLKAHGLLKDTLVVWGGEFG